MGGEDDYGNDDGNDENDGSTETSDYETDSGSDSVISAISAEITDSSDEAPSSEGNQQRLAMSGSGHDLSRSSPRKHRARLDAEAMAAHVASARSAIGQATVRSVDPPNDLLPAGIRPMQEAHLQKPGLKRLGDGSGPVYMGPVCLTDPSAASPYAPFDSMTFESERIEDDFQESAGVLVNSYTGEVHQISVNKPPPPQIDMQWTQTLFGS